MTLRCAYCHDLLGEPRRTCGACGTHLHPDCRAALGGCPTLGCRNATSASSARPPERPWDVVSPAERRARMVLGLVLLLIMVVGCCIPAARLGAGPFEWAAEQAEIACEPAVAEAARRLIRERFPQGSPTDAGVSVPREALPPELRRLPGQVYVTATTLSTATSGSFGDGWGVLIGLDPAAEPDPRYERDHLRKAGPGVWSWVSPG